MPELPLESAAAAQPAAVPQEVPGQQEHKSVSPFPPEGARKDSLAQSGQGNQATTQPAAGEGATQGQPGSQQSNAQSGQQGGQNEQGSQTDAGKQATQEGAQSEPGKQTGQQNNSLLADADPEDKPIEDWGKVDLKLGEADVNGALMESFGQQATELGLTPRQARGLAQWQIREVQRLQEEQLNEQREILAKAWGNQADANQKEVARLCDRMARVPGLEKFREEFIRSGASANASMMRAMHYFASMLREDQAGRINGSGVHAETAEEGIRAAFAAARGM